MERSMAVAVITTRQHWPWLQSIEEAVNSFRSLMPFPGRVARRRGRRLADAGKLRI